MPLKKGKSKSTIQENIRELMHSYEEKGKIGNTTPRDRAHAQKIAVAIAIETTRPKQSKSKEGGKGGKGKSGKGKDDGKRKSGKARKGSKK